MESNLAQLQSCMYQYSRVIYRSVKDLIDLAKKRIVVVKSTNHFHAAFSKVAVDVLYCDSDGPIPRDHRKVPYTRVQRPIWPLDEVAEPAPMV